MEKLVKPNQIKFDQKSLKALRLDGELVTAPDPQTPGLYFRMTGAGAKIFIFVYRMGGRETKQTWFTLGSLDDLPLNKARERARACRA